MKNYILKTVFLFILFVNTVSHSQAAIQITEIMYDPISGGEWMEVHNPDDTTIDLKGWKLFDGVSHTISTSASVIVSPGEYLILADDKNAFLASFPNSGSTVLDIVTSFNNDGDTLILRNASGIDQAFATYGPNAGASKNGKTLQLQGGVYVAKTATPGQPTSNDDSITTVTATATTTTSSTTPSTTIVTGSVAPVITPSTSANTNPFRVLPSSQYIYASAGGNRIAVAGAATSFTAKVVNSSAKAITNPDVVWSFGDGGTSKGINATHTFNRPGVYAVLLEANSDDYIAKDHVTIEVIVPKFSIPHIQTDNQRYIEIKNETSYEIDLTDWLLQVNGTYGRTFSIPKNTYILPRATISFPSTITGLNITIDTVALLFPNTEKVVEYDFKKEHLTSTSTSVIATQETTTITEEKIAETALSNTVDQVQQVISSIAKNIQTNTTSKLFSLIKKDSQIVETQELKQTTLATTSIETATDTVRQALASYDSTQIAAASVAGTDIAKYKRFGWVLALVVGMLGIVALLRFTDTIERKEHGISKESDEYEIVE